MELIDTHTHIYIEDFREDYTTMMERAKDADVSTFFLPSIDSSYTDAMLSLESDHIKLMMGLHPCSITPNNIRTELDHVKTMLYSRSFYAVGEIGIDLHWDKSTKDLQIEAFEEQISWAIDLDLPIVIHSRKSTAEVIEVLKANIGPRLRGIFHCFGGSLKEANEIIDLGFVLGIGGVVTFKNAGLDKTVSEIDLEHIVLETDAPYLSPAPNRGKRNEPAYLRLIAEKIAKIKGTSIQDVARTTTANAKKVFRY